MKSVISFYTTADVMEMERVCKQNKLSGRIIPVPREISAGCGLAWSSDLEDQAVLVGIMDEHGIEYEEIHRILL